jgi:hypothetical protein
MSRINDTCCRLHQQAGIHYAGKRRNERNFFMMETSALFWVWPMMWVWPALAFSMLVLMVGMLGKPAREK